MNKICLLIPYFGSFPTYYQLFLDSCGRNPSIDWMIFTDNKENYEYPFNVKKVEMSFEILKQKFQDKFKFKIEINEMHKLCDFKPAYGYLFEELIGNYDYWGHCDLDLIWGDLEGFLKKIEYEQFEKLFDLGHLALYKNTQENNRRFMLPICGDEIFKKIYHSSETFIFDEGYKNSINNIFIELGISICPNLKIADIYTKSSDFLLTSIDKDGKRTLEKKTDSLFFYREGKLLRYTKINGSILTEEFAYIHLQKRLMKVNLMQQDYSQYAIIPNAFEKIDMPITMETWDKLKKKHINLQYFRIRYRNLKVKIKRLVIRGK